MSHKLPSNAGPAAGNPTDWHQDRTRLLWLIPAVIVVLDQATKWIVAGSMTLYQSIPVFGNWFRITYIHNPGGAFGVEWGYQGLYYAAALLVILWIGWHLWKHGMPFQLSTLSLALILGGAIGNLIDRTILGEVIDFLDFEFPDMRIPHFDLGIVSHPGLTMQRWPTFNIADSAVTVGVLILIVSLFYDPILRRGKSDEPIPASADSGIPVESDTHD